MYPEVSIDPRMRTQVFPGSGPTCFGASLKATYIQALGGTGITTGIHRRVEPLGCALTAYLEGGRVPSLNRHIGMDQRKFPFVCCKRPAREEKCSRQFPTTKWSNS